MTTSWTARIAGWISPWWVCALILVASDATGESPGQKTSSAVETKIGMEGVYYIRYATEGLVPRGVKDRSPIMLRVAGAVRDKDSLLYELRYIGTESGEHDLRDYLARTDGKPLGSLQPLMVVVRESLPKDHAGQIEALPAPSQLRAWPYRALLRGSLVLWGAVTFVLWLRYLARRRPRPIAVVSTVSSLADQLQPLVEAYLAGGLSVAEQARLEMLLLAHWCKLLSLRELAPEEALRQMRSHEVAGKLLRDLEAWLYARPGTRQVDVAALLAPYRGAAPLPMDPSISAMVTA